MIILGVAVSLLLSMGDTRLARGRAESYHRIPMHTYQNFPVNWDEQAEPRFYALIRTPQEYDQLFHPAPIGRDPRPFHPEASPVREEPDPHGGAGVRRWPRSVEGGRIFEVER
jgi:hypothetical protein